MTGDTHRAGGVLLSVVGFAYLKNKGLLLPDVSVGLQWLAMYPFTLWGSTCSDLDHHWDSCPSKDLPSRAIHAVLHITKPLDTEKNRSKKKLHNKMISALNAKHRSWQTHSDWTVYALLFLLYKITSGELFGVGTVDTAIASIIGIGIGLGVAAHFFLDMLTTDGIWIMELVVINKLFKTKFKEKWGFVPRWRCFRTSSDWERFICKLTKVLTWVALGYLLYMAIKPYIPYSITIGGFEL